MKQLAEFIIKNIVKNPQDVSIAESLEGDRIILTVTANKEDIGTIIGKQGRIIKAIREVIRVKAIKDKKYFDLRIAENL